jgi:ATP-dependent Clp protease protease subunit
MANNSIWSPMDVTFFGSKNKMISLWGSINEDTSLPVISQIMELDKLGTSSPITILMNTEGGSQMDAYAIYDAIKSITTPVTVIATGLCASAGLIVLSAANYKLATPNTMFFYHQTIMESQKGLNSLESSKGIHKAYEMLNERYDNTIIHNSKISKDSWNKSFKDKTIKYFNSKEALHYGIINDIITFKDKDIDLNKYRSMYGIQR